MQEVVHQLGRVYLATKLTRTKFVTTFHGTYNFKGKIKKFYEFGYGKIRFNYCWFKFYFFTY